MYTHAKNKVLRVYFQEDKENDPVNVFSVRERKRKRECVCVCMRVCVCLKKQGKEKEQGEKCINCQR